MKHVLTILLFILPLVSCRKNKPLFDGQSCNGSCYILAGKLVEMQTSSPLSNTLLKFYYRPAGYYIFFDPTQYLGNVRTASDGSYSFKFESAGYKSPTGSFRIEGSKQGYIYKYMGEEYKDNELLNFHLDSSKINIPQINNLILYRSTTLKFSIKASTITNFQFLTIGYSYGTSGYGAILNGNRIIDTTLTYKTAADIPTYISWDAKGNGVNIEKKDTIVVASGTEQTYQISL
jgi:hypothetical protein